MHTSDTYLRRCAVAPCVLLVGTCTRSPLIELCFAARVVSSSPTLRCSVRAMSRAVWRHLTTYDSFQKPQIAPSTADEGHFMYTS